jgi:hypothetical protein
MVNEHALLRGKFSEKLYTKCHSIVISTCASYVGDLEFKHDTGSPT